MHSSARILSILIAFAAFATSALAQKTSPDRLWQQIDRLPDAPADARIDIQPREFKTFTLDARRLRAQLANAPRESAPRPAGSKGVEITLPMPDGSFARFEVEETQVMESPLAAKYPQIKAYIGRGLDDRSASLRLDINPRTFHAQILSPHGAVYIDPYWHRDGRLYMSYRKSVLERDADRFKCFLDTLLPRQSNLSAPAEADNAESGKMLRTYRLACATSIQYSQYHSDPVNPVAAEVLAALVTMMNRVSGIYETELGIRMILVANNDQIIATASNPTPFTDTPGDIFLNPPYLDSTIGAANYDIGHVVTVGSGGVAGLGVVCAGLDPTFGGSAKAAGTTGFNPPVNDPFWVDYVAHEMGHQFGGNHTFNGSGTNCGAANQNPNTAYEPGSGSTIQAYAGICGAANNLQPNSDPYYHFISLIEMFNYSSTGDGGTCPVATPTGNNPPTVSARAPGLPAPPTPAFTIPDQTPFSLTALNGMDPEGDSITYCWEEADLGPEKAGTAPDNGLSALFRSFLPNLNPTRTFPRWPDLLANQTQTIGEKLPLTTRKLDFRITARDGRGGFGMDSIRLNVVNTGDGFKVTEPNTAVTWSGGSTQTVTWDVAGTTANGINTANVDILLTTDATPSASGPNFDTVLVANTPNDGTEMVTIPMINQTTTARVMVRPVDNVYFDISDQDFTISGPTAVPLTSVVSRKTHGSAGDLDIELSETTPYTVECRSGGTTNDYTLVFTFANTLTSVGGVSLTGTGTVASSTIGSDAHEYIVQLTGVTNAQTITLTLANVSDSSGNNTLELEASLRILLGDTTGNGSVNSSDVGQAKGFSGQTTDAANFRADVNTNGAINSSDIGLVKTNSGTSVP